ncbi:SGNH/GDSL hydrolase family protein [Thalassococcus sp. CAU 1522]|uniref:SGNH/GDSL hydrolase family protein n=1 Tax=Thalassococcus arenae TaxID=2851652 RepID=A0ABS6N6Z2_9RHOB|nr:SGNH/GDSL hydrolase family protein [Thalassococcus arenae]MBV2359781.1 SGNH/GDSL hydrolase family protein [Thalassococcus arenae]
MVWRTLPLMPVVAVQAVWVAARAARMPEAAGAREGRVGAGPVLRLLVAGDSSAAGVGVAHQDAALLGRLVGALAQDFAIEYRLCARSGATAGGVAALLRALPEQRFDAVVFAVGVNDAKNGHRLARWRAGYGALLDLAQGRFGARMVYASGLPPVQDFPRLPRPLRDVMGVRFSRFDAALAGLAAERCGACHLPMRLDPARHRLAEDGLHPGPSVYAAWGQGIAERILADFSGLGQREAAAIPAGDALP